MCMLHIRVVIYVTGTIGVQNKPLISTTTTLPTTNTTGKSC